MSLPPAPRIQGGFVYEHIPFFFPPRVLLVVLALALLGLYAFIRARAGALQAGAAFTFDYTVTSTASEPSPAYSTLRSLDALTGSVAGQSSGDSLYLAWYNTPASSGDSLYLAWYNTPASAFQSEQAPGPDQAFTDLYVKDGQVYLNVRQIYRTLLSGLTAQYPAASALIPDWGLGDYITQAQLARLLNSQPAVSAAGGYSAWTATFTFRPSRRPGTSTSPSASPCAASGASFSTAMFWWSCPARASASS